MCGFESVNTILLSETNRQQAVVCNCIYTTAYVQLWHLVKTQLFIDTIGCLVALKPRCRQEARLTQLPILVPQAETWHVLKMDLCFKMLQCYRSITTDTNLLRYGAEHLCSCRAGCLSGMKWRSYITFKHAWFWKVYTIYNINETWNSQRAWWEWTAWLTYWSQCDCKGTFGDSRIRSVMSSGSDLDCVPNENIRVSGSVALNSRTSPPVTDDSCREPSHHLALLFDAQLIDHKDILQWQDMADGNLWLCQSN